VVDNRLVCPYHEWNYAPTGEGRSPSNLDLKVCAQAFDIVEQYDLIWIKSRDAVSSLPTLEEPGFYHLYTLCGKVNVSVETLLDNFTEIEHTATAHWIFGYSKERLAEVKFTAKCSQDRVRSLCSGPQKKLPPGTSLVLGIRTGDSFDIEFETNFAPLHTLYYMSWQDPRTESRRTFRLKEAAFFSRISSEESQVVAFYFSTMKPNGRLGLNAILRPIMKRIIQYEFKLDRELLDHVVKTTGVRPSYRPGRFDQALIMQHQLMNRLSKEK
jgi:phenylpropionate dioxygenase-like ring-hydroxylating dioxygenase large terminal subunit